MGCVSWVYGGMDGCMDVWGWVYGGMGVVVYGGMGVGVWRYGVGVWRYGGGCMEVWDGCMEVWGCRYGGGILMMGKLHAAISCLINLFIRK